MRVLVTGNAGFIGFHLAKALLERGDHVVGFDSVNDYYDPRLKEDRLRVLERTAADTGSGYTFVRANLADRAAVEACFGEHRFERVIHLAAQAGVRYAAENPHAYVESNIVAFTNVLEACRHANVAHLIYASSSSVYGANSRMPFSEHHGVDHPLQFYAATKRANELMAHAYSHLFRLPTTGLRFFTAYGPWGRPDMALFRFTKNILEGKPIQVFGSGDQTRDFTYIDDIVEGIIRAAGKIASADPNWRSDAPDPATSNAPYRIFNLGNNRPAKLNDYISAIETALGVTAKKILLESNTDEMRDTFADVSELGAQVGYRPKTTIQEGVAAFVDWYRAYYGKG